MSHVAHPEKHLADLATISEQILKIKACTGIEPHAKARDGSPEAPRLGSSAPAVISRMSGEGTKETQHILPAYWSHNFVVWQCVTP